MAGNVRNVLVHCRELADVPNVGLRLHATTLYNSIYRFDEQMLVNAHMYGFPAAHAPVLHLRKLSAGVLFDTHAESFKKVWAGARLLVEGCGTLETWDAASTTWTTPRHHRPTASCPA
jgi:hypothetical protein